MADVMLKRDSICPGCHGRVIWHIERVVSDLEKEQFGHWGALPVAITTKWLQTRGVGNFEAFICKACGLTEWYAHGIEELQPDAGKGVHLISNEPEQGLR